MKAYLKCFLDSLKNHYPQLERENLHVELKKIFVPQQTDTNDDGIYLLAFVENLFKSDFNLSSVKTWCSEEIANEKRRGIEKNILDKKKELENAK